MSLKGGLLPTRADAVGSRNAQVTVIDRGVADLHFCSMNRADLVFAVCHLMG
jgi:hypothetical protein